MTADRTLLARHALRKALEERRQAGVGAADPICVYDLVERRGTEVKFWPVPSMEGMYYKTDPPVIVVSSERPAGRQASTCAHEYGHHVFGHGTRVDKLLSNTAPAKNKDPKERLADIFAGYLLMPRRAVEAAFVVRGWDLAPCTPLQAYIVAGQLGVGYETLIQHMRWSLQILSANHAEKLLHESPKQLRISLLGEDSTPRLLIVDQHWTKVAADLQVGETAILPRGTITEGKVVRAVGEHDLGTIVQGYTPGTERAHLPGSDWAVNVRVSRKGYIGRSMFRHFEDPDDNDQTSADQ